jgi:hypothetical protein
MMAMAMDRNRLIEALTAIVADPPPAEELPRSLSTACQAALPVDGVGLTLMTGDPATDEKALLGASNDVGAQIEQLQFDLGEGPCRTALSSAAPVLIPNMRSTETHQQWPRFARETASLNVGALFAFPLLIGTSGLGVMDCHRTQAGPLTDLDAALTVVDTLTLAVLHYTQPALFDFDTSWRRHAEVHQATGWLADELHISTAEALARLRRYAFATSRPLRAVAADVLAGQLDPRPRID